MAIERSNPQPVPEVPSPESGESSPQRVEERFRLLSAEELADHQRRWREEFHATDVEIAAFTRWEEELRNRVEPVRKRLVKNIPEEDRVAITALYARCLHARNCSPGALEEVAAEEARARAEDRESRVEALHAAAAAHDAFKRGELPVEWLPGEMVIADLDRWKEQHRVDRFLGGEVSSDASHLAWVVVIREPASDQEPRPMLRRIFGKKSPERYTEFATVLRDGERWDWQASDEVRLIHADSLTFTRDGTHLAAVVGQGERYGGYLAIDGRVCRDRVRQVHHALRVVYGERTNDGAEPDVLIGDS
ncbi:MAG: hypothetical protein Q7S02_04080, partial [bacterium]|nr:hypothetical protein [bacterium]